jgi:UDP-N-acetylmuramoyl-L-alanyl-D-glutamate--2,6-diaminopimelate ligase
MEQYADSKALLFKRLDPQTTKSWPRVAVVNADDPWAERMLREVRVPVTRYSMSGKADVFARDIHCDAQGSRFTVVWSKGHFPIETSLVGDYNVANAVGVTATALALGFSSEVIQKGLRHVPGVPGRMERVVSLQPFSVIVDYAHTEDALRKVMAALRRLKPARLITVFGCGGDRDRTKRPLMGAAAAEMSDRVFVTSDNPRSEDPEKITLDIEVGVRRANLPSGKTQADYEIILDRELAIRAAIAAARPGDIVLIAGKGHETYQIVGAKTLPFDDREVAQRALAALPAAA